MQETAAYLLELKGAIVLGWLVLLFALERAMPMAPLPAAVGNPSARWARNVVLWGINSGFSIVAVVPLTAYAASLAPAWRPAWLAGSGGFVFDLILLDGFIYWWHRATHRVPFLWRFHSIHHLDRFLDTTTAVRFHFGEVLLSALARAAAVIAFAIPLVSVLGFETLLLAATIFHHSNLRLAPGLERALSRVFVTPSIHWVHHHRLRADTDSNYSTVLSIWDPIFRSRSATRRTRDLEIGVEGREETGLASLIAAPFL